MGAIATTFMAVSALAGGTVVSPADVVIGRSAQGRPIRALRIGSARAPVKLMVVGVVHGNEQAGRAVVDRLRRRARTPRGTALWLIEDANPDGSAARSRHNANGGDLNRNFPFRWRPQDGVYESGPGPASEPETRAIQRFVRRERPRATLWYHQALSMVVASRGDPRLERIYARASGLPRRRLPAYRGTATSWQNRSFPRDSAFVVELPGGPLPRAAVRRHAGAVLRLARAIAPRSVMAGYGRRLGRLPAPASARTLLAP